MSRMKISDLSAACIHAQPRDFNWGDGYSETWETVFPSVDDWDAPRCLRWLYDLTHEVNYKHRAANWAAEVERFAKAEEVDESDWDETATDELRDAVREKMQEEPERYSPMMNSIYPLADLHDAAEAQAKIEHTTCVVVLVKDAHDDEPETPFLALAGGGMDLSWDICKAYMLLGYLPPVHFCRLPRYAGKKLDTEARWIIAGCKESCRMVKHHMDANLKDLAHVRKAMQPA